MQTKRRTWLKQIGLGAAAFGLRPITVFANRDTDVIAMPPGNKVIRLSSNENAYGPSPAARAAMTEHINTSNRYGWDLTAELIGALAKKHSLTFDNVLLGAGSTELLDLTARYAALNKGNLVVANPTYDNWTSTSIKLGLEKISVVLNNDKQHDLNAMLSAINTHTRLVYICNPNNPTGSICDHDQLLNFVTEATKRTLVMIDEAYIDFTNQRSLSGLVANNKNLVVVKTFSKIYGLAGARVGYALAHAETLQKMAALQTWSNGSVSVASVAGALASLKDTTFVSDSYAKNELVRRYTIDELTRLNLRHIPSNSNFIYFSLDNYAGDYFSKLKAGNIQGTRIYEEQGRWTRITVGTMKEMQQFIRVIA